MNKSSHAVQLQYSQAQYSEDLRTSLSAVSVRMKDLTGHSRLTLLPLPMGRCCMSLPGYSSPRVRLTSHGSPSMIRTASSSSAPGLIMDLK